jgi:hypothetical protein
LNTLPIQFGPAKQAGDSNALAGESAFYQPLAANWANQPSIAGVEWRTLSIAWRILQRGVFRLDDTRFELKNNPA